MKTTIKFTPEMRDQLSLGRKTQTRRPIKNFVLEAIEFNAGYDGDPTFGTPTKDNLGYGWFDGELRFWCAEYPEEGYTPVICPYGAKGTVLPVEDSDLCIEITKISVERVQEISEDDCLCEGVGSQITRDCKKPKFAHLWNSIYGDWDKNPWVWVIEFNVLKGVSI